MYGWVDGRVDGLMYVRMHISMYVTNDGWMDG